MAEINKLMDEYGIIHEGVKILSDDLNLSLLEAITELEDDDSNSTIFETLEIK